ncbi:hypothetical protein PIB30_072274, partial [Stylosanthes scabra]|nr:hypothetical protein [Stylosanthes scabra]
MENVYDRVEWEFQIGVLKAMGFPQRSVLWSSEESTREKDDSRPQGSKKRTGGVAFVLCLRHHSIPKNFKSEYTNNSGDSQSLSVSFG